MLRSSLARSSRLLRPFSTLHLTRSTTPLIRPIIQRQPSPFIHRPFSATASPSIEPRVKKLIESTIAQHPLVVFMKGTPEFPQCGFSRLVIQILDLHGVEKVHTMNVLDDMDLREGVKVFSQWPTIPQVYINGEFIGGCDIMRSLHENGELKDMLKKAKLVPDSE